MIRWLAVFCFVLAVPALAALPGEALDDPAQEARARALMAELRCMRCQNEAIDASPSPFATEVRQIVRQQIVEGRTNSQIKDYLVARHGEAILFRPRVNALTWLLWFGPLIIVLIGGWVGWSVIRRAGDGEGRAELSEDEEREIAALVDRES